MVRDEPGQTWPAPLPDDGGSAVTGGWACDHPSLARAQDAAGRARQRAECARAWNRRHAEMFEQPARRPERPRPAQPTLDDDREWDWRPRAVAAASGPLMSAGRLAPAGELPPAEPEPAPEAEAPHPALDDDQWVWRPRAVAATSGPRMPAGILPAARLPAAEAEPGAEAEPEPGAEPPRLVEPAEPRPPPVRRGPSFERTRASVLENAQALSAQVPHQAEPPAGWSKSLSDMTLRIIGGRLEEPRPALPPPLLERRRGGGTGRRLADPRAGLDATGAPDPSERPPLLPEAGAAAPARMATPAAEQARPQRRLRAPGPIPVRRSPDPRAPQADPPAGHQRGVNQRPAAPPERWRPGRRLAATIGTAAVLMVAIPYTLFDLGVVPVAPVASALGGPGAGATAAAPRAGSDAPAASPGQSIDATEPWVELYALAAELLRAARPSDAAAVLQAAAELAPGRPEIRYELAWLLHRMGDVDGAREQYRIALASGPDDAFERAAHLEPVAGRPVEPPAAPPIAFGVALPLQATSHERGAVQAVSERRDAPVPAPPAAIARATEQMIR